MVSGKRANQFCVGEWDRDANTQILYCGDSTFNEFYYLDLATWILDDSTNLLNFHWHNGGGGIGTIGGWDNNGADGNFCIFESWGYALRGCARVHHTDGNLYHGLALIDLNDANGKATLLDVPTYFAASPGALFEAPQFNGDSFVLGVPQFAADDDSLPATPKGVVYLSSSTYLGDGAVPSSENRVYLKAIDWNPLGIAAAEGSPNRVHLRETLMTRLDYVQFELFGTNTNSAGAANDGGTPSAAYPKPLYHPPSRTFVALFDWKYGSSPPYENERGIVRHSIVPGLSQLEPPTQQSEIETAKTTVFRARAMGDLGEAVAGVTGTWSLARRSTVDEDLDTSAAPAFNIVAHPPIDEDTLVVKYNGTPLTEGVDYSVVESTGTITWMGAHSPPAASGYTASYRHSTVSATPSHGTLLQETTETDTDGFCESRVQYPDDADLVGGRDRITVSIEQ